MKFYKRLLLILLLLVPAISSCSTKNDSFSLITTSESIDFVDEPVLFDVKLSNDSFLKKHDCSKIKWVINDELNCKLENYKINDNYYENTWTFKVSSTGLYTINAYIDNLYSINTLSINVVKEYNSLISNLTDVINQEGGLILGASYDLGLSKNDMNYYSFEGIDGVLQITDDGKLEVIGIDNAKLILKKNGNSIFEKRFAVAHSILCTNIKNELIEQGIITSQASRVTNEMLKSVNKLNLSSELQNDLDCVLGLKYLINLEEIDISDNNLSDISWLSYCPKLKSVNLSNNRFKSLENIEDNQEIQYLDVSNNEISDISSIKFLPNIKYLDLTNNSLKSINDLSTIFGLESLFISNNDLDEDKFHDRLSGLENLVELGVGNCNIKFTDIKSLGYINNLRYLDITGTSPSLESMRSMNQLETLIMSDCQLSQKNLNALNDLKTLTYLDISNNSLNKSNIANVFNNCLFHDLEYLNLGGNEFTELPDLSCFSRIVELDLTDSYNLVSIDLSSNKTITSLILDDCNSLNDEGLKSAIEKMESLEKLSIQGGFNYLTRDSFDYIVSLVTSGKIELRFIGGEYVNKNTVYDYKSCVFFSYDELLEYFQTLETNECTLSKVNDCNEIILSLINEIDTSKQLTINIDKTLFKLCIFGNPYKSYNIEFDVLERKNSSFTFDLYSFASKGFTRNSSVINAENGSKVIINSCHGINKFVGTDGLVYRKSTESDGYRIPVIIAPEYAFKGYDLTINSKNDSAIYMIGGNGGKGPNHSDDGLGNDAGIWEGMQGGDGASAVKCHNIILLGKNITISGGNGGDGGNSNNNWFTNWSSGDGGDGGHGIEYIDTYNNYAYNSTITGGIAGVRGNAEGTSKDLGENGKDGLPIYKSLY